MHKMIKRLEKGMTTGERVFIASGAVVIGDVTLEDDVSVWYNTVLRGDVEKIHIGKGSNIQDGTVIHVTFNDCPVHVGEYTSVGHKVCLHGCDIGSHTLIGIGSIVLDRAVIPDDCIVAAGSIVPPGKTFPSGHMIMGQPAKAVRPLTDSEKNMVRATAKRYIEYATVYLMNEQLYLMK